MTAKPDPMHKIPEALEDRTARTGFRCSACREEIIWNEGWGWMHRRPDDGWADFSRPGMHHVPRPRD